MPLRNYILTRLLSGLSQSYVALRFFTFINSNTHRVINNKYYYIAYIHQFYVCQIYKY